MALNDEHHNIWWASVTNGINVNASLWVIYIDDDDYDGNDIEQQQQKQQRLVVDMAQNIWRVFISIEVSNKVEMEWNKKYKCGKK